MKQFDGEVRHNIIVSTRPTVLDREITALGEPLLRKTTTEPRQTVCKGFGRHIRNEADDRHDILPGRSEWPCER